MEAHPKEGPGHLDDNNNPRQQLTDRAFIDTWNKYQSPKLMAEATGLSIRGILSRRRTVEARHGIKLESTGTVPNAGHFPPPDGFSPHGVSTLFDGEGNVKAQWVKTKINDRTPEEWTGIVKDAFTDSEPVKPIPRPKSVSNDLLVVIPIGDHHVAMYAWGEETGNDYDIKTAERLLTSAATYLVEQAPAAKECV